MINTDFRLYDYYYYGENDEYGQPSLPSIIAEEVDEYGQPIEQSPSQEEEVESLSEEESSEDSSDNSGDTTPQAKIAIYLNNQSNTDNINYKDATYVGFTYDSLGDNCVIDYDGTPLKVLYVNPQGRMKQLYMAEL